IQELLKQYKQKKEEQQEENLEDCGAGTILDSYTTGDLLNLANYFMEPRAKKNYGNALRDRAGFLIQHSSFMRGEGVRALERKHMWGRELENESPTQCFALGLTSRSGKTNKNGRIESVGAMQHKDVFLC
ncbi:hypothetical protein DFS34DRAFT_672030, partial [Phlyctochytrium arcticum]